MKKLYTILSTIILSLLAISPAFAVCESSDNFWNTLQNANYQFTYTLNNGATQTMGASDGTLITANNVKAYGDLTTYFDLDHLWKYINLTGIITITSTVPNQLSNEFIINNMSSPTLLYQLDNGGFVEWGTCDFTSMTLNNLSEFVVNSSTGTDRYNQQNINYSVKCYAGENAPSTKIKALRFHLWKNQYNSSTSMNANISIVHHLASDYQTYQGEYHNELCRIQEQLQGISSGGGSSSQDIENQTQQIIQNDNDNTQQIIDNQNDIYIQEDCTSITCNNLFNMSLINGVISRGITAIYNSSNDTLSFSGTSNYYDTTYKFDTGITCSNNVFYMKLNKNLPSGIQLRISNSLSGNGIIGRIIEDEDSVSFTCPSGNLYFWLLPMTGINGNGTVINLTDYTISISENDYINYCKYGTTSEECTGSNRLDNLNNSITDVNNTLNNPDVSQGNSKMEDIIENFEAPDYGFAEFIYLPFNFFRLILNPVCQPIQLHVPYVTKNDTITLPCYNTILQQNFPSLMTLIHIVTDGLIVYYCCVTIFRTAQNVLDPEKANLEVFDL